VVGEFEGKVQIESLIGSGDRNVFADQDGVLRAYNSVKYASVAATVFAPSQVFSGTEWANWTSGAFISDDGGVPSLWLQAPVQLPHGAVVESM